MSKNIMATLLMNREDSLKTSLSTTDLMMARETLLTICPTTTMKERFTLMVMYGNY